MYDGPPRGGTRGGRDQFKWEDVKSDKYRECYIGHSVKAATGRWQKNKDLFWYTKSKSTLGLDEDLEALRRERDAVREAEQGIMQAALGGTPAELGAPVGGEGRAPLAGPAADPAAAGGSGRRREEDQSSSDSSLSRRAERKRHKRSHDKGEKKTSKKEKKRKKHKKSSRRD